MYAAGFRRVLLQRKGSALADLLQFAFIIVFVMLPLFAAVSEGYIILNKTWIIRDAMDLASIASYNAMSGKSLGKGEISISGETLYDTWKEYLAKNLKLKENLEPENGSVVDRKVEILELEAYVDGLPETCSRGVTLTRPSVHSVVSFAVTPSLFGRMILKLSGHEYLNIVVHVDSEIPVNQ